MITSPASNFQPILDQQYYRDRLAAAVAHIDSATNEITAKLRALLKIEPGPYLLFNQMARFGIRVRGLQMLLERLFDGREQLREIDLAKSQIPINVEQTSSDWPAERRIHDALRLDFESLFLFGSVTLDLWAVIAAHVRGSPRAATATFDEFRASAAQQDMAPEELLPFIQRFSSELLWLAALLRFYRNRLGEHRRRLSSATMCRRLRPLSD
jgi:hypothetical protein